MKFKSVSVSGRARMVRGLALATCLAGLVCGAWVKPAQADELPRLGADLSQTSVSGLSSGGYMAAQFQLAHGDIVVGAGIIAAGPYGCAESSILPRSSMALFGCMSTYLRVTGSLNVKRLVAAAQVRAKRGDIAPIHTLRDDRVMLFTGALDKTVAPTVVAAAEKFYLSLGIDKNRIHFVSNVAAGHGFPTLDNGNACSTSARPYVIDCDRDTAGEILSHIYGRLKTPPAGEPDGEVIEFSQHPFAGRRPNHSLHAVGLVFVPTACRQRAGCRVHVAFHGCRQTLDDVGQTFVLDTGYLRWAAVNRMIVLFPQVRKTWTNPRGCWDWWGYTGPEYLTRRAPQISTVRAMLARLAKSADGAGKSGAK